MPCLCSKRLPCPTHKDKPLSPIVLAEVQIIVIRVKERWPVNGEKSYFATVAVDAFNLHQTTEHPTRKLALKELGESWPTIFLLD